MVDLDGLAGFEWDEGNRTKNWDKHQVTMSECEEAFFNLPLLLADDSDHSQQEKRFYILGQTNLQRKLFISFTIRKNMIRVISARDMSRKERQVYGKTTS
jgi:uncharacterized DUF497 family protein